MEEQNRPNKIGGIDGFKPYEPPKHNGIEHATPMSEPIKETANESVSHEVSSLSMSVDGGKSIPVVKVLSVRGLEYLMMSVGLWLGAGGLLWGILTALNGGTSFAILAMPASLALVGILVFAGFFVRLKKAELKDPSLRFDASKRRTSQITQLLAFIVLIGNLITFVYICFTKLGGGKTISLGKASINLLVVSVIAGGILLYYWFDEHKTRK